MIITNLDKIPGKEVQFIEMVSGSSVYAKNIGRDFMAGLKNMVGGELKGYTEMVEQAKNDALEKMESNAKNLGADAILGANYSITNLSQGSAIVVLVVGTAVKFM